MINFNHKPVLLKESVDLLDVHPGSKYIDATIGGGGHTEEILKRGGFVLGIDRDEEAIEYLKKKFGIENSKQNQIQSKFETQLKTKIRNLVLVKGNFADIGEIAHLKDFEKVSGILFDLGMSSQQIDNSGRGFTFLKDEPLDMRMDKKISLTAHEIINKWSKEELYDLFSEMAEERFALAISDNITRTRRIAPIKSTLALVEVIKEVVPAVVLKGTLARVFQAVRIGVNREIENLKEALLKGFELLAPGGRMVIISFHSLEDRLVKQFFKAKSNEDKAVLLIKKPVYPSFIELKQNRRARSAKLRVLLKKKKI